MSHLALGDYLYQRTFLQQLKEAFPHIVLDVWFDDFRRVGKSWQQGRNDIMSEWLKTEPFIDAFYPLVSCRQERLAQFRQAKEKQYDIVLFIGTARSYRFAYYARRIGGENAYCAGVVEDAAWSPVRHWFFRHLDLCIQDTAKTRKTYVLQYYGDLFRQLTGIHPVTELSPLKIPETSAKKVAVQLKEWHARFNTRMALMVNAVSTTPKRDYPWKKMADVLERLYRQKPGCLFIVNTPPHLVDEVEAQVNQLHAGKGIPCVCFTSQTGVDELSALVDKVDGVLSVETAIIHFAAAVGTPLVALMRQKTSNWCPPSAQKALFSPTYVDEISVSDVTNACLQYLL